MRQAVSGMFFGVLCFLLADCGKFAGANEDDKKNDSLFLGISLGMERKAFYDYCWEQNKKKLFIHGPTNQNVQYQLLNELEEPVAMRFYPTFYEDKIYEMPVTFTYEAWAPWNRRFWADSLLVHMVPVFKRWYGDDFKKSKHPTMGDIYYKIDGTRRINLFRKDDQYVQAVFTDLKVERKLKAVRTEKIKAESERKQ